MHIGPAPQLMDFFALDGKVLFAPPRREGNFLNGSFLWGLGGLQWIPACAGMTGFWVIIMFYKMC